MGKYILPLALFLLLYGCATAPALNKISLGMVKSDVIKILGNPNSVSAKGNIEYLSYTITGFKCPPTAYCDDYFVRLIDGKVESYGKAGDFDSIKVPETKTTVDLNINK